MRAIRTKDISAEKQISVLGKVNLCPEKSNVCVWKLEYGWLAKVRSQSAEIQMGYKTAGIMTRSGREPEILPSWIKPEIWAKPHLPGFESASYLIFPFAIQMKCTTKRPLVRKISVLGRRVWSPLPEWEGLSPQRVKHWLNRRVILVKWQLTLEGSRPP